MTIKRPVTINSEDADEFEEIVVLRDRTANLRAVVAIHDTKLGPAFGGIRRVTYRTLDDQIADAMKLARAMTLKCALAGFSGGGGKATINDAPGLDRRATYRTLARWVENRNGRFYTGPDVGTTEADLRLMRRHTRFVIHGRVTGAAVSRATARGVIAALAATVRQVLGADSSAGLTFAVQGLGAIGGRVADHLHRNGANLIVADVDPTAVERFAGRERVRVVSPRGIVRARCDVLVPCALGGVISIDTPLRCRAICGAANNPLAGPDVAAVLHRRGIVVAPDFVANAGGVIHGALAHLEGSLDNDDRIDRIGTTLAGIFRESDRTGQSPETVAVAKANRKRRSAAKRPMKLPPAR